MQQGPHDAQQLRMSARHLRDVGASVEPPAVGHQAPQPARVDSAPHVYVQVLTERVQVLTDTAREYERILRYHAYPGSTII